MENNQRVISVQTDGANNFLVTELQPGEKLIPYCCKMLESNNIPGLLPMRHQIMDGVVRLRYMIGGRMRLGDYLKQHHLSYDKGILLLQNLTLALMHLGDYFLQIGMCDLDPEQIYIGDGLRPYLLCLPVETDGQQNQAATMKRFYENLLSEYFATSDCSSYDQMFKWVYKASIFDLQTFYDTFLKEGQSPAPAPKQPRQPQAEPPRAQSPAPPDNSPAAKGETEEGHELTELLQSKLKGLQAIYPGVAQAELREEEKNAERVREPAEKHGKGELPFAVPGSRSEAEPPEARDRTSSQPRERHGRWPFGGREKNNTAEVQDQQLEFAVPSGKPGTDHPAVSRPQKAEEEGEGTILVQKDETPSARELSQPEPAWFLHQGQRVAISKTPFVVGKINSGLSLDYAIYDNNKVSRSHATFLYQEGKYWIRDNQSRNGTTLNGKALLPLRPYPLQDGDEIRLYNEVLVFHTGKPV